MKKIKAITRIEFKVGDTVIATDRVWNKDTCSFIKKGKTIRFSNMDDIILLPQPHKWKKHEHSKG